MSKTTTPQSTIDHNNHLYYLSYPKSETSNSYVMVWDYEENKFFRWTGINCSSMIFQRVSGSASRVVTLPSDDDGQAKFFTAQGLTGTGTNPSATTSGVIKFGYWSLPRSDGSLTNMEIKKVVLKIMMDADFNGTIALNFKTDWDEGAGTTVTPTAWTNATDYKVKHIVYPVNQTCHHIQLMLTDTMTAGAYGVIGITVEYEDGSEETYGKHTV